MVLKRFWGLNRGLDWSQGLLGEALGVILGPKAAWDSKKGPGGQNVHISGPPFGDQITDVDDKFFKTYHGVTVYHLGTVEKTDYANQQT